MENFNIPYELATLIFSGMVAISTIIYVYLTGKLVSESRKTREFYLTPDINIYLDFDEADPRSMYIVIINRGFGTAQSVKFKIIKDFQYYNDEGWEISKHGTFSRGLENFYPNQKFKYFLTDLSEEPDLKIKEVIEISVSYFNIAGKKYVKNYLLPFEEISGGSVPNPPGTYIGRIAYELGEIKKELRKIKWELPPNRRNTDHNLPK